MFTLEQYAQIFNLTCACVVLVVSLFIQRRHSSTFFRKWLVAYGLGTAMLLWDVPSLMLGRPLFACVLQVALCVGSAWYFVQAALSLHEKRWPTTTFVGVMGFAVAASTVALSVGVPFAIVSVGPLVLFTGSVVGLGVTTFRFLRRARGGRLQWLGATFVAMGVIPLAYPLVVGTPLFALGLWAAGVTHLMVGFGMVYFLLDDAVRQAREENERLLAQEKARTNFLSTVSHELRTPLTSVLGYLELMEDGVGGDLSEDHAAFASEMRVGAQHLASLIDSLLDSGQISAGALAVKKQVVDLRACIGMAVSTMGTIAEKGGVTVLLELPDSLPAVVGDSQRVAQVVINLLSNAVKFTPPGGQVRVSAEIRDRCVHVAVTDTGIGIPLERQAQIFEPFFQVDNSLTREYGGSGLGLWIVKNLVTAMGGAITVESQPGNGSTFTFTLAIAPELGPTPSALRMGASAGSAPAPHSPPDRT